MNCKREHISTGVIELDPILGGLLKGDNVVWYDDAGSLAAVFCMNFLQAAQMEGHPFIYVSFDRSPKNLLEKLGKLAENENLTILDCFTYGKGKGADVFFQFYESLGKNLRCRIINVTDPRNPDAVMEHFLHINAGMKKNVRFVFESLTGMQELWEGEEKISLFYSHTCPKLYELDTLGYWIMEKDVHSKKLKASINQIAQVVIELALKRGKTSLSVVKAENRELENLNTPNYYWTKGVNIYFDSEKSSDRHIDVGRRIRELRIKQGLSQKKIARMVGVTASNISQIESNQIYPSLPALYKMAEVLSINVSTFFREHASTEKQVVFSEKDGVEVLLPGMPKESIKIKLLTSLESHTGTEPCLIELGPETVIDSHFFMHKGQEFGYLLSGNLGMKLANSYYSVKPGDMIHLASEIPSQWENTASAPAKLLWFKIKP